MGDKNNSDDSSDSEISPCSSKFDPLKVLYSQTTKIPIANAPQYENIQQFENALKYNKSIIPVGRHKEVEERELKKITAKEEEQKRVEEKNKQRFAKFQLTQTVRKPRKINNVLTRIESAEGPLSVLKECVDKRLRIKVITRCENRVRGVLHATLVAFDKQWNLALSDVLEVWTRKKKSKRKVPPGLNTPVDKGTAGNICSIPVVTEKPLGNGVWECTRHIPQLMMRGEHVVMVNIVER